MVPSSAYGQIPIASVVMGHFRNKENKEKLDNDFNF